MTRHVLRRVVLRGIRCGANASPGMGGRAIDCRVSGLIKVSMMLRPHGLRFSMADTQATQVRRMSINAGLDLRVQPGA